MKKLILIFAFLVGTVSAESATEVGKSEYVDAIKSGVTLVEFYSPNCPHCKKMEPLLERFEKSNPSSNIIKINVDKEKTADGGPSQFMQDLKITSWPTYVINKDGNEIYRFKGSMEYERFQKLASISEKMTTAQIIDMRIEALEEERKAAIDRGNQMSEEFRRIQDRITQIPAAIEELKKLKEDA